MTFRGLVEEFAGRVSRAIIQTGGSRIRYVAVKTGEANDALSVLSDAVDQDETGKPIVNMLWQGKWMARVVEPGLSLGGYTEIKSGISVGDIVQLAP